MSKAKKLLLTVLGGLSDANIKFEELCDLLRRLGFDIRIRRSHHIFRKAGIEEKVNIQRDGTHVKPYQVRQIRQVLVKHKLGEIDV